MLYVLVGENREAKKKRIASLQKEATQGSELLTFSRDDSTIIKNELIEWMNTEVGLFGEKIFATLDAVLEKEEIISFLQESSQMLAASKSTFIFLEEKLTTAQKKLFTEINIAPELFESSTVSKDTFSIFALTDAFCARDKKQTWAILQKTLQKSSPEEIHGTLWWQIKILLQVSDSKKSSAESLGIKPFIYSKAAQALKKYSREEIEIIGSELVAMYHNAHRGIGEFSMRLEQLILKRV